MKYISILTAVLGLILGTGCIHAPTVSRPHQSLRIAVYNIRELSTDKLKMVDQYGRGSHPQVRAAAEVIKRVNPDVLLICEIDHDYSEGAGDLTLNLKRFKRNYLDPLMLADSYQYYYVAPCNTGILSGVDLDNNGEVATEGDVNSRIYGNDCFGFGNYPGQYSMAILSRYKIDEANARTFQQYRWIDLPENHFPEDIYSEEAAKVFRLSSKSHWDVPVQTPSGVIHLLASHPTPQGFDGPEDRNGKRNFDEIKLSKLYIDNDPRLYDDKGISGGLPETEEFIFFGDHNASPGDRPLYENKPAMAQILEHPRVQDTTKYQTSKGSLRWHNPGPPDFRETHTYGWDNTTRIDYVLPSKGLNVTGGGVFWPTTTEDMEGAIFAEFGSDHRLVWIDLRI